MSFNKKYLHFGRSYSPSQNSEIVVQPNLAITPAKMAELVDSGIPVSSSLLSGNFNDGVTNPSWDIPIDERRGVDVAQVWNAQRQSRKNITHNVITKE